ncbi:tRNA(Ile)-lysidine synthase [Marivirga lumbricoides]|uniref:tRNA(Ile)-lysidine synthase n=1 Tax=Marivirga lumbricoides TaxID=1046115 RepID=A0ABQ1M2F5_9BACT|nr:tRNA(Ile)-lysidine synthase [Marivirga lumbricoides]
MLTDSFLDFISKEKLFSKQSKLLLAISGGVDSVVLAHLLFKTGYSFALAHMNFQLRGEDSEKDQAFVEKLAEKYSVDCHIRKVEILKDETKGGESTQMQARSLRYQWFEEIMDEKGYDFLLTAHHAEDSFETVLLNLSRGTGIKGVRGILPMHAKIARPLLFADKVSIKKFAEVENLTWREDVSNQSDNYRRNEIRHHVVPRLLDQNPNLFSVFGDTSLKLRAAEDAFEDKVNHLKSQYVQVQNEQVFIEKRLLELKFGRVYLAEILKPFGFSLQHLQAFSFNNSGARLQNDSYCLVADRDKLIVFTQSPDESIGKTYEIKDNEGKLSGKIGGNEFSLGWRLCYREEVDFSQEPNIAFLDAKVLEKPVFIRKWAEGDKFQPLGMKGKKKVSDFLIDEKISLPDKEKQIVLLSGDEIAWLVNHRISDKFKISPKGGEVLKVEYKEID